MAITLGPLVLIGLSLLPVACRGQADDSDRPEVFTERVVDAIRSRSAERRKTLVHPRSLACWTTPQAKPFFDEIISRQLGYTIPASYSSAVTHTASDLLMFQEQLDYPVRPTWQIRIHFDTEPSAGVNMVFSIVHDAGRWYEVLPCPRPDTIANMQSRKDEVAKRDQRAQMLAAQLADPVRAELVRLAKDGRRTEAIQRYASTSGEDLAMARRVVELVVSKEP